MNVRIPQIMIRNLAAAALSLGFLALSTPLMAQDDFAYGRRLFLDKAQCSYCHGWAGDGAGDLEQALLPVGEVLGELVLHAGQVDEGEELPRPLLRSRLLVAHLKHATLEGSFFNAG